MMNLSQYVADMKKVVKGKEKESQTAKKLLVLAEEFVKANKPLTIKEAGTILGIKYPNYLHQVIKANGERVKKVKVNGRALVVPASLK